jgi:hypothetical protein
MMLTRAWKLVNQHRRGLRKKIAKSGASKLASATKNDELICIAGN